MVRLKRSGIALAMAMLIASPVFHTGVAAAEGKKASPVEGAVFNASFPLGENLNTFMGRDIYVHLRSGKTIQGYVKSVGDHFLHLEKLAGREFYDALVRIDDISALEARSREMK